MKLKLASSTHLEIGIKGEIAAFYIRPIREVHLVPDPTNSKRWFVELDFPEGQKRMEPVVIDLGPRRKYRYIFGKET